VRLVCSIQGGPPDRVDLATAVGRGFRLRQGYGGPPKPLAAVVRPPARRP
jgi:hypothetical protein